jgi:MFS family permease
MPALVEKSAGESVGKSFAFKFDIMGNVTSDSSSGGGAQPTSWLPLVVICLSQMLVVMNPAVTNTTIGAAVADLATSATTVQTGLVLFCLVTAALTIAAGKAGKSLGALNALRMGVGLLGVGLATIALTPIASGILAGQAIAGIGAATLFPTFLGLIVANYQGKQQATAVGWLGAAAGIGGAIGLLAGGFITSILSWRAAYLMLVAIAITILGISLLLRYNPKVKGGLDLDIKSVLLSVFGVLALVIGINQMGPWGLLLAKSNAPFNLFGLSPALPLFGAGVLLLQGFFAAQVSLHQQGRIPLLSPLVWDTALERSALAMLILTTSISAALGFVVPLYMQLVQGFSPLTTGIVLLPFAVTVFAGAIASANLATRFPARQVGFWAQIVQAIGLLLLAFTFANEWSTFFIVLGLCLSGTSIGVMLSVLSMVLVSASPPELGGDVGALRGTSGQLGSSLGTALMGLVLSTALSNAAVQSIGQSSVLPAEFKQSVDLSNVRFTSNAQLEQLIDKSLSIDAAQKAELLKINQVARLNALRIALLFTTGLALLGLVPSRDLPGREVSGLVASPAAKPSEDLSVIQE